MSVNEPNLHQPKPLQVIDGATGAVLCLGDFISSIRATRLEKTERPQNDEAVTKRDSAGGFVDDARTQSDHQLARNRYVAQRADHEANKALERLYEDIDRGRPLSATDVRLLTPEHQEVIYSQGDDGMRQLAEQARKHKHKDNARC